MNGTSSMYSAVKKVSKHLRRWVFRSGLKVKGATFGEKVHLVRTQIDVYDRCISRVEWEKIRYMAEIYRLEFSKKGGFIRRYERLEARIRDVDLVDCSLKKRRDELISMLEQYTEEARQEIASLPSVRLFGF